MADVTIQYKGSTIAEMSESGTKTLKTSGKYCENDIYIQYEKAESPSGGTTNAKVIDFTIAKKSGWILLTTLDDEVLSHINDNTFNVLLCSRDAYVYESYSIYRANAGNIQSGKNVNGQPLYGVASLQSAESTASFVDCCVPANNTNTTIYSSTYGFRVEGSNYYFKPRDGFFIGGNCRLIFSW